MKNLLRKMAAKAKERVTYARRPIRKLHGKDNKEARTNTEGLRGSRESKNMSLCSER
jgi:hypothetical protein